MPGRPDHRERAPAAALEHAIDRRDRRAGREQRDLVGVRRRKGIEVERGGAPRGLADERDVLAIVDAGELLLRCLPRLQHLPAALPEL